MSVVLIWNNNMVSRGHTWPGHASMQIGSNWNDTEDYVSWVPAGGRNAGGRFGGSGSLLYDLSLEGCAPDHILLVDGGFNRGAMRGEWNLIKQKSGAHYRMYRKNCSNIMARVLKAGNSAGGVANRHNLIWTPLKIKRLALEMGGKKQTWKWLLEQVAASSLISTEEQTMLEGLYRKDFAQGAGSTHNGAYHANGYKIAPMVTMISLDSAGQERFAINKPPAPPAMSGGSLYSGGNIQQINDQIDHP